MEPIPIMIKIFVPSSRVVNPAGTLGNSMLEPERLRFTSSTNLFTLGETLGFTGTSP